MSSSLADFLIGLAQTFQACLDAQLVRICNIPQKWKVSRSEWKIKEEEIEKNAMLIFLGYPKSPYKIVQITVNILISTRKGCVPAFSPTTLSNGFLSSTFSSHVRDTTQRGKRSTYSLLRNLSKFTLKVN